MKTLKAAILEREQTPISYVQIKKITAQHVKTHFVLLDDLPESPSDQQIFGNTAIACVLCTKHIHARATSINHWILLIKRKGGSYEFFDPLGNSIKMLTMQLHNGKQSLVNWASNRRVSENTVKLQQSDDHVNTCGMHIAMRAVHSEMRNTQYAQFLKHAFLEPDLTVSLACYLDLIRPHLSQ